jgi:glycosyltransferase involved in cell wall biosynthesis
MADASKGEQPLFWADVIVVADRITPLIESCLQNALECSGPTLNKLIIITRSSGDSAADCLLLSDPRVTFSPQADQPDEVEACNRGLGQCAGDVAVLPATANVSAGWLSELAAAAHSEERTAFAWPLSKADFGKGQPATENEQVALRHEAGIALKALSGLPRWTATSSIRGDCVYLRGVFLDAIGSLDSGFSSREAAITDWVMRAQALGFFGKRANHVYLDHARSDFGAGEGSIKALADRAALDRRHPHFAHQAASFAKDIDGRLAQHAIEFLKTGKLRVAFDIRHIPSQNVGTRTYAVKLAEALNKVPEIELTLLVSMPVQATGFCGPVVHENDWRDEYPLIHKPAQFFKRRELAIPFGSSAHVVITYQDLIAYRVPTVFRNDDDSSAYRTTSSLSLLCASGVLAYSRTSQQEIAAEFGLPADEIAVAPLGADSDWFAHRDSRGPRILRELELPDRYFFSLATDYPHKNLSGLLEAYALLKERWKEGAPPELVLAGYALGDRNGGGAASQKAMPGVTFLGPVSAEKLRVLYQHAEALVFPSLYEGFGLPPLEAMAAGTPVIAMPTSSVPEVSGDAAIYADGLSADHLSRAMERVAGSEALRSLMRKKGLERVEQFRWEQTAQATFQAYCSAVLRPTERSLQMRRLLREAILSWSQAPSARPLDLEENEAMANGETMGVRNAWNALNTALQRRVRREVRRLRIRGARQRA